MRLFSLHACLSICLLVLFTVLAVVSAPVAVGGQHLARLEQLDARTSKGTKRPAAAPAAAPSAPKKLKQASAPAPAPAAGGSGSVPSVPSNSGAAPKPPAGAAQGQTSAPPAGAAAGHPQPAQVQSQPPEGALGNGPNSAIGPKDPTTALPFQYQGVNMPATKHPKGTNPTTYSQAEINREAANAVDYYNRGDQIGKKGKEDPDPGRKFPHEMPNKGHVVSNMPAPFPPPGSEKPQQANSGELKEQVMSWPIQPNSGPNPRPQSWGGNLKNLPADRLILTKDKQDCNWETVNCIRHETQDTNKPPKQGGFVQGDRYRRAVKALRRAIASLGSSKSLSLGLA